MFKKLKRVALRRITEKYLLVVFSIQYREIERRKKEKNSPVGGPNNGGARVHPNHSHAHGHPHSHGPHGGPSVSGNAHHHHNHSLVSPVSHERADSDSTNFSSMNAPSSPPSESGSSKCISTFLIFSCSR